MAEAPPLAVTGAVLGSLDELAGFGRHIAAALAPHAIYTVSEELLRWTAEGPGALESPDSIYPLGVFDTVAAWVTP